jgi:predicted nucleotidyltransferase
VETKAPVCYICFMKRDEVISRLQQHEADLKRLGVEHLYMFGSTARGEAGEDSDVALFFDGNFKHGGRKKEVIEVARYMWELIRLVRGGPQVITCSFSSLRTALYE